MWAEFWSAITVLVLLFLIGAVGPVAATRYTLRRIARYRRQRMIDRVAIRAVEDALTHGE